jgi:hypothetical protein
MPCKPFQNQSTAAALKGVPCSAKAKPDPPKEAAMTAFSIENVRIDADIGDGIAFTVDLEGVAHRFFVSRATLGDVEHSLLASNHDMVASFERQSDKIKRAIDNTLKFGTSHNITFLKKSSFD